MTTRSPWLPVPGRPDLEAAAYGRVRRIPTVRGKDFVARPHRTKRIVLSIAEIAALGAEVIQAIRSLFEKKDDAPVENDLGKIPGPAARAPEKKR